MRRNRFLISFLLCVLSIVLQSTFFQKIAIFGVVPDISLIFIVFCSNSMGALKGEVMGFSAGLVQDILSSGPLGFNAISRTIIGFLYGKMKGKLFLDSILLPVLFVSLAAFMKEGLSALTAFLFLKEDAISLFGSTFFIELGMNALLSPVIFWFLRKTGLYRIHDKDTF